MELELIRAYFSNGTNGDILHQGKLLCNSIELPWLHNQHKVSCIPEGRYELRKRYNQNFGWHLIVMNVPERSCILLHAANDAKLELEGCIAPVSLLVGEGKGIGSRIAVEKVKRLVYEALNKRERVFLTIKPEVK